MGLTAKALGIGSTYTFEKRVLHFCGWTQGVQAEFELYLEDFALANARRLRKVTPNEELGQGDPYLLTIRDINSGVYSFGGAACNAALRTDRHLKRAILIMLGETPGNGAVDYDLVEQIYEKDAEGLIRAMLAADHDPNSKAPASTD